MLVAFVKKCYNKLEMKLRRKVRRYLLLHFGGLKSAEAPLCGAKEDNFSVYKEVL